MVPLEYVHSTQTLFVAFSEGINYRALYAIEQMMNCRTEACMAVPSFVKAHVELLRGGGNNEIVFGSVRSNAELCDIIRNYCVRICATELRLAQCGHYVWIRLLNASRAPIDLLTNSPSLYEAECGTAADIPAV